MMVPNIIGYHKMTILGRWLESYNMEATHSSIFPRSAQPLTKLDS